MKIPFTTEEFLGSFEAYNVAWWPLQVLLAGVAGVALLLALRPMRRAPALAGRLLAVLWAWTAVAYHLLIFTGINTAAYGFAFLFLWQAYLLNAASRRGTLVFGWTGNAAAVAGLLIVAYALLVYPLVASALGHSYPAAPTFGAPCPVVIFTFGLLLLTRRRPPAVLLVIPGLWALIGTSAALRLGMLEDIGLPLAALLALGLRFTRERQPVPLAAP
jgi:hypothetical protein